MTLMIIFFGIFALSYANGLWLNRHLRTIHPEVWARLGEPSLAQSNLGAPRLALNKFVWSLQFRSLNDPVLSLSCSAAMVAEIAVAFIFVALLVGAV